MSKGTQILIHAHNVIVSYSIYCDPLYDRLKMKRGTIISRLYITLDMEDENYLPERIDVMGGELDNLQRINDTRIDL